MLFILKSGENENFNQNTISIWREKCHFKRVMLRSDDIPGIHKLVYKNRGTTLKIKSGKSLNINGKMAAVLSPV